MSLDTDEIRKRLVERDEVVDHDGEMCPMPSDGNRAYSVPHVWGAGRDKAECVDCDRPRWTWPNRKEWLLWAPDDIAALLEEVERLRRENRNLKDAL